MIEELEPIFEKCSDGVARQFPPHPYDLMDKINEIIRYLNEKDSHEKVHH